MNRLHRIICRSPLWRFALKRKLIPWALDGHDLGQDVLEVGPGPGLTTELLRTKFGRLTVLEIDPRLADALKRQFNGSNVAVKQGNACEMPFADQTFSGVVAFTMLHHVPSQELQDRLFAEVHRVLRLGGVFAGTDSRGSWGMRLIHINDTMVPVDPCTLASRLRQAGFEEVSVSIEPHAFRFFARKPS